MSMFIEKRKESINVNSPLASSEFSDILLSYLDEYFDNNYEDLVIVCIGTDRSTGDSLGPITGYKLSSISTLYPNVHVLGTLDEPVHAKNLSQTISSIETLYNKPFVIAIDASLGNLERVGYITISNGPLQPGAGVNKVLPTIGDINITGIVNLGGFMEYMVLQNTRLNLVMKMADIISTSFNQSISKHFNYKKQQPIN